jgi:hypothetical protein
MIAQLSLAFAAGAVVGFVVALFVRRPRLALPKPEIGTVSCQPSNMLRIPVSVATDPNVTLAELYSKVWDNAPASVSPSPITEGATPHPVATQIDRALPSGLSGPTDFVVVWARFQGFSMSDIVEFSNCSGGSFGGPALTRMAHSAAAAQLEAVPRAYKVSSGSAQIDVSKGPAAHALGTLLQAPAPLLQYVPESSTPVEPFWRGKGGAGPAVEWSLRLLHRTGGFGAVLSLIYLIGGRETRLTWVTSTWRFHAANRLTCESDDAGVPTLLVQPA